MCGSWVYGIQPDVMCREVISSGVSDLMIRGCRNSVRRLFSFFCWSVKFVCTELIFHCSVLCGGLGILYSVLCVRCVRELSRNYWFSSGVSDLPYWQYWVCWRSGILIVMAPKRRRASRRKAAKKGAPQCRCTRLFFVISRLLQIRGVMKGGHFLLVQQLVCQKSV